MSGLLSVSLNDNLNVRLEDMLKKLDQRVEEIEPLIHKYETLSDKLSTAATHIQDSHVSVAIRFIALCGVLQTIFSGATFILLVVTLRG